MKKERLIYIDYIKTIGLFLVILAHVDAPSWIQQIRSFDVPLLVFVSGYLASKTYHSEEKKFKYYQKRFVRLVIPAWIFLLIFYAVTIISYKIPCVLDVIKAFSFQRDADMVGMLWIIWVYLVCAFLVPFIYKIGLIKKNVFLIVFMVLLYEAVCSFTTISSHRIIYSTVLTIIPWGAVTYFGFYYDYISKEKKKLILIIFSLFFFVETIVISIIHHRFVFTFEYKYPPKLYYLLFSLPLIILIFELLKKLRLKNNAIVSFISSSSLWIYLWHILLLYVVKSFIKNDNFWILQYVLIICTSCAISFFQNIIVKKLINKTKLSFLKVFLG